MNLYPRPRRYPYRPIARKPWPRDMPGVYLDDFHLNVPPPLLRHRVERWTYSPATVVVVDLTTGERTFYPPSVFTTSNGVDVRTAGAA